MAVVCYREYSSQLPPPTSAGGGPSKERAEDVPYECFCSPMPTLNHRLVLVVSVGLRVLHRSESASTTTKNIVVEYEFAT